MPSDADRDQWARLVRRTRWFPLFPVPPTVELSAERLSVSYGLAALAAALGVLKDRPEARLCGSLDLDTA